MHTTTTKKRTQSINPPMATINDALLSKHDPSKLFDVSKCLGEGTFGSVWLGKFIHFFVFLMIGK